MDFGPVRDHREDPGPCLRPRVYHDAFDVVALEGCHHLGDPFARSRGGEGGELRWFDELVDHGWASGASRCVSNYTARGRGLQSADVRVFRPRLGRAAHDARIVRPAT